MGNSRPACSNMLLVVCLSVFVIVVLCFSSPCSAAEEKQNEIQLDADKLTYENATGIASAEGNVKMRNKNMRIFAPYAEYDTNSEVIKAFSDSRNLVTLLVNGNRLSGQSLQYNIATRKGVMTNTSGKVDAIFFKGSDLQVMPLDEAIKQKLVAKRSVKKRTDDDMLAQWLDVESTTCDFTNPCYKFVSKQIIVIPGKRVVIKRPQVYLGKSLLFTYPFDYIASLAGEDEKTTNVMPMIGYDSDKGAGIGMRGPISWDGGQIDIGATYWTDDIWEATLGLYQKITENVEIFTATEKTYNKDDGDSMWRQKWGINYNSPNGWRASLMESQRELVETEMRVGMDTRFNLWRSPEFSFTSPWFRDFALNGYYRFFGMWGRYQDNVEVSGPWAGRLGVGAQIYGEPQIASLAIRPFYNTTYWYYDYDDDNDSTQKVADAVIGLRWGIGSVGLATAYSRRWVSGGSPLFWDRYLDREDIYQQISYTMPGNQSWEQWTLSVRAGYDMIDNQIAEMIYSLEYKKHCITWELWARDSRPDDELSIGLKFMINAYPDTQMSLGLSEIYDPFEVPAGIKEGGLN
ncbi:MAG: hypothetical protein LLF78_05485 [Synergistaceae bacterium]|nr:hypothetical protein [Synergistaceae bacterium]